MEGDPRDDRQRSDPSNPTPGQAAWVVDPRAGRADHAGWRVEIGVLGRRSALRWLLLVTATNPRPSRKPKAFRSPRSMKREFERRLARLAAPNSACALALGDTHAAAKQGQARSGVLGRLLPATENKLVISNRDGRRIDVGEAWTPRPRRAAPSGLRSRRQLDRGEQLGALVGNGGDGLRLLRGQAASADVVEQVGV